MRAWRQHARLSSCPFSTAAVPIPVTRPGSEGQAPSAPQGQPRTPSVSETDAVPQQTAGQDPTFPCTPQQHLSCLVYLESNVLLLATQLSPLPPGHPLVV